MGGHLDRSDPVDDVFPDLGWKLRKWVRYQRAICITEFKESRRYGNMAEATHISKMRRYKTAATFLSSF